MHIVHRTNLPMFWNEEDGKLTCGSVAEGNKEALSRDKNMLPLKVAISGFFCLPELTRT